MRVSTVRLGAGLLGVSLLCGGLVLTGITCDGAECRNPDATGGPDNFEVDFNRFTLEWEGYCDNKCATGLGPILVGLMALSGGVVSMGAGLSGWRAHVEL